MDYGLSIYCYILWYIRGVDPCFVRVFGCYFCSFRRISGDKDVMCELDHGFGGGYWSVLIRELWGHMVVGGWYCPGLAFEGCVLLCLLVSFLLVVRFVGCCIGVWVW